MTAKILASCLLLVATATAETSVRLAAGLVSQFPARTSCCLAPFTSFDSLRHRGIEPAGIDGLAGELADGGEFLVDAGGRQARRIRG